MRKGEDIAFEVNDCFAADLSPVRSWRNHFRRHCCFEAGFDRGLGMLVLWERRHQGVCRLRNSSDEFLFDHWASEASLMGLVPNFLFTSSYAVTFWYRTHSIISLYTRIRLQRWEKEQWISGGRLEAFASSVIHPYSATSSSSVSLQVLIPHNAFEARPPPQLIPASWLPPQPHQMGTPVPLFKQTTQVQMPQSPSSIPCPPLQTHPWKKRRTIYPRYAKLS